MSYTPNIPLGSQSIASTQQPINNNFTIANTAFGVDHQAFTVNGPLQGFHKKVTLPSLGSHPNTPTATPVIYSNQDSAILGVLAYTMLGGNSGTSVATPISTLQSGPAFNMGAGATVNILDFSTVTQAVTALFYAENNLNASFGANMILVNWDGTNLHVAGIVSTLPLFGGTASGNILVLKNSTANPLPKVAWTLQFIRIA